MFESLTKFIPDLSDESKAKQTARRIQDAVFVFDSNNPKCGLKYYRDILRSRGVNLDKTPLSEVDISGLSWLGIMALLYGAVSAERRKLGTLDALAANGSLVRWLSRLKEIDEQKENEKLSDKK